MMSRGVLVQLTDLCFSASCGSRVQDRIDAIYENMFGSIATSAVGSLTGGSALLELFGHMSWTNLVYLTGLAGAGVLREAVKAELAARAVRRECAISYLLNLGL
jgi:hypothetical protein